MLFSRGSASLASLFILLPTGFAGYVPAGAKCQDYVVPVNVTSLNYPWVAPKWSDNYGFIDFASTLTSRTDFVSQSPVGVPVTETAGYNIAATFCTPKGKPNANAGKVLLATHGLGFDRSYWNSAYNPNEYNFVQYAIQRGYSVFFYDRLGVGNSTKVSGFKIQHNIHLAVLTELLTAVRAGHCTTLAAPPTSVILIGHSYGSFMTNSLVAANPTLADAAIMTGYSLKGNDLRLVLLGASPHIAKLQSGRFSAFDAGYITTGDVFANINWFFKAPAYTHDVAARSERTKQPFAIAEMISLTPSLLKLDASAFKGPALVISGQYDWILCGGYCEGELDAGIGPLFPNAKNFETYVQPHTGHSLNFATNATGSFEVIFDYLKRNGL